MVKVSSFQIFKIFKSSLSGKICLLITLKVTKKQGFTLSLEHTVLKKLQAGQTDLPQDLFWIRKSCVVKYKTLKRELNSWNIQSIDTTESKRNLVDRNTFTIFLKMSQKASESIKAFCRMDNCAVSFLRFSIFKDYVKSHY